MKPTKNRRLRPCKLRGLETLEDRFLLSGGTAGQDLLGSLVNTVFQENFDGPSQALTLNNSYGSGSGLWHTSAGRAADGLPGHSPPKNIYFGQAEVAPSPTLSWEASIAAPVLAWGPTVVGTGIGSAYYLNDTVVDGNVLGARIAYGPYEQDKTGAVVHALQTVPTLASAKSAVRLGDYVYFTGDDGGVYRTQVANTETPWTLQVECAVPETKPLETLATDGTLLYASTTDPGDQVQAYSVDAVTGALTLVWSTSGIAGRVRGLDWDSSGYIYAADGGGPTETVANNTAHLYAIAASTGEVTDMGLITFNGRLYQTVREGNQVMVFDSFMGTGAPAGQMYVYDLASDTSLVSTTPANTWDPAGIGRIFGAAIDSGTMWLTSVTGATYGYNVADSVWRSSVDNTSLTQWTFAGASTPLSTPASTLGGASAWYHFPPAATMASLEDSQGDAVTGQDAAWELVFRPTNFTGTHVLLETGGNAEGTAFVLVDDTLEFRVQDADSPTERVVKTFTFNATADVNKFHHVVATVHPDATAGLNSVRLFVDGVEVGTAASAPGVLSDWSDTDGAGLGAPNGLFPDSDNTATPTVFDGDVALVRFYGNRLFNAGEVKGNFDQLAAPTAYRVGNYDTGAAVGGEAVSPAISLPAAGTLTLSLDTLIQVDPAAQPFDLVRVVVKNTATQAETTLLDRFAGTIPADSLGQWLALEADLTPFRGQNVQIIFRFDTGNALGNSLEGWHVDNVLVTQTVLYPSLDADGNGTADALSDGILILRYLFDPTGAWNVSDALGAGAARTTREDIKIYLDGVVSTALDADGNSTADALSDGILILRYLFDPTGAWNVSDALGSGATRTTREDIKAYLDQYNPAVSSARPMMGAGALPAADPLPQSQPEADKIRAAVGQSLVMGAADTVTFPGSDAKAAEEENRPDDLRAVDVVLELWNRPAGDDVAAAPIGVAPGNKLAADRLWGDGSEDGLLQLTPWETMASATLMKPATLAPWT